MRFRLNLIFLVFWGLLVAFPSSADKVTPSERVKNSLTIRAESNGESQKVGQLLTGKQAKIIGEGGHHYQIRTANGLVVIQRCPHYSVKCSK